jgi:phosphoenolpyruvate synthase/pyruvate phosphate dikinase
MEEFKVIKGLPASSGKCKGIAKIVEDVSELGKVRSGDILVAQYTDPNWVPVFYKIAGVVTDYGGVCSHAAVIAREVGIPAVTGTEIATQVLRDGVFSIVDGAEGVVRYRIEKRDRYE